MITIDRDRGRCLVRVSLQRVVVPLAPVVTELSMPLPVAVCVSCAVALIAWSPVPVRSRAPATPPPGPSAEGGDQDGSS